MRIYQLLAIAALCAVASVSSYSKISLDTSRKHLASLMMADPLFEGFSQNQLLEIIKALKGDWVKSGTVVVKKGEPVKSLYITGTGKFVVLVGDEKARLLKKARILEIGESFGELGLLGNGTATATVVAIKRGKLLSLDKQSFNELVAKHIKSKDLLFKAKNYV